jgi:hypothetical protein
MLTRMLAVAVDIDKASYEKMRAKSIHDVKTMNGSIDILEAVRENESDDL